ncbi:hypothetical protein EYB45_09805 [Erythrobacteraceae bacterium CFH 75059]|uniref:hypothetical protein n=1 Tax=Qipengyuania thermophila TaxID=2509361 RepID=UPI0010229C83|nr:hypothetical protein [Qipengyuania thermophila]TCD02263.1 hypothetical protein EYB45_09805 [Erythrobacteraceae bacterium CFH 75059]
MSPFTFFGAAAAALATLAMPAAAAAQQQRCVTRAESQAVVAHLMPDLLRSVQSRCGPLLGESSFLRDNAGSLAERMTPLSRSSWPAARAALERQSGSALPDNPAILDLGRQALAGGVANSLDADSCRLTDQLLTHLAPLPPENLANVFALFLEAGANTNRQAPLRVCPSR